MEVWPTVKSGHTLSQGVVQDKEENTNKRLRLSNIDVLSGCILLGGLNLGDSNEGRLECQNSASGPCVEVSSVCLLQTLALLAISIESDDLTLCLPQIPSYPSSPMCSPKASQSRLF